MAIPSPQNVAVTQGNKAGGAGSIEVVSNQAGGVVQVVYLIVHYATVGTAEVPKIKIPGYTEIGNVVAGVRGLFLFSRAYEGFPVAATIPITWEAAGLTQVFYNLMSVSYQNVNPKAPVSVSAFTRVGGAPTELIDPSVIVPAGGVEGKLLNYFNSGNGEHTSKEAKQNPVYNTAPNVMSLWTDKAPAEAGATGTRTAIDTVGGEFFGVSFVVPPGEPAVEQTVLPVPVEQGFAYNSKKAS